MKSLSRTHVLLVACLLSVCAAGAAQAGALRLHNYFTDHMVLQRAKPITVVGFAEQGAKVEVTFADQTKTATAGADGKWAITLEAMGASAQGRPLKATAGATSVTIEDVVVGDVYLFGRQTSTDISLSRTAEGQKAAAQHRPSSNFRAITVKTIVARQPVEELNGKSTDGWSVVDSDRALQMTGSAFYLGRDLAKQVDVPVGIVDVNMGVYFALGWLSDRALTDAATLHPEDKEIGWLPDWMREQADKRDSGEAQKELEAFNRRQTRRSGVHATLGLHPLENPMYPCGGYNAVIHPLRHVAFKSVLLQLGNDYPFIAYNRIWDLGIAAQRSQFNRAWGQNYKIIKNGYRVTPVTLPYVPADWRRTLGDGDLPIGLILPPSSDLNMYALHNREVRELHRRNAEQVPGLGLILPGMDNIDFSGQPADDQLLAERCGRWLLSTVYGQKDLPSTGPIFERVQATLNNATVYFKDGTAEGLKARGDALKMFEVAGSDGEFYPAEAKIDGSTIQLISDQVGQIVFVRFNWVAEPDMGLVNAADLPAVPFNTDDHWRFAWIPPHEEIELPEEYHTTADKWAKKDIAIINGTLENLPGSDSQKNPHWPGPLGIQCGPFGPNLAVVGVAPDSPADGRIKPGDLIYGVNGQNFGDDTFRELANAITHSETEEAGGKLVMHVRRGSRLMDVTLELEVMGAYSPTTPYYCPKSQRIVERAEQWSLARYRPESGSASSPAGMLNTDLWFLLATGNPEVQGLVRRAVYQMIERMSLEPPSPHRGIHNWNTGYAALLLGEYFHATGDPNVLAYLNHQADQAAVSQIKEPGYYNGPVTWEVDQTGEQAGGWRQRYNPEGADRWKSGYGLMPHAGMACTMGMQFAKEAGLEIDEAALRRAIHHYNEGRAEYAFVLYGYKNVRKDGPAPIKPGAEAKGMLWSMNGKLGTAATLYSLIDYKGTVDICARYCVYGYNNTRHGHGGMFFNNLWTPIGAFHGGEAGFKHFMQGQTWWRELFRRPDGSFDQAGRGRIGVAYGIPYVAHHKRLRMLGAPRSLYADPPAFLKPAIDAHRARDYTLCIALIEKELDQRIIPADQRPAIEHLLNSVKILQQSIEHDLAYTRRMIEQGNYDYALLELPQLQGVVAADNPQLRQIIHALQSPEAKNEMRKLAALRAQQDQANKPGPIQHIVQDTGGNWLCLTPIDSQDDKVKPARPGPAVWKMVLVEDRVQAPHGWTQRKFDDSQWLDATLPMSWTMYHTALFRHTFTIDDKKNIRALRFRGKFFQQANVVVYLNGEVIAKIDNIGRSTGDMTCPLTDYAVELLKNGENTIAVSTRHRRRWGPMRGTFTSAATCDFALDANIGP